MDHPAYPKALILDGSFQPLTVVSWQKAITLLLLDKAEALEFYEHKIASATKEYTLPAILKIKHTSKKRPAINFNRHTVFSRDNFSCCYCGDVFPSKELSLDHVLPLSQGGKKTWNNIVTSCYECNRKKGNKTPEQAGMIMLHTPHEPKWNPNLFLKMSRVAMEKIWEPWLYRGT